MTETDPTDLGNGEPDPQPADDTGTDVPDDEGDEDDVADG